MTRPPVLDLELQVHTRDVIGRHIYKYGAHDRDITALLRASLAFEPGDVVLDIGANIGWYSLVIASLVPNGVDIYAFEPHPANLALLRGNINCNAISSVHIVAAAVSDRDGDAELFEYGGPNSGRHSLLPLFDGQRLSTPTLTLDGFWKRQGLGNRIPRFIKVDIEGFELAALRSGQEVLQRCPMVLMEYSPHFMRAAGLEPESLADFMFEQGFGCFRISHGTTIAMAHRELRSFDQQTNLLWRK